MEVAQGIRRLGTSYVNFYLIEEGGKLTLLDAGLPGYWKHLVRELELIGRRPADIDAILLTHLHPDHVGLAERARASRPPMSTRTSWTRRRSPAGSAERCPGF